MRWRDFIVQIAPGWLQRSWGGAFLYVPGLMADALTQWTMEGIRARFPGRAPDDALPVIGRDRLIRRGFDEPRATYERRLLAWLDSHRIRGNPCRMLDEVAAYLAPHAVRMRTVSQKGTWVTRETDGSFVFQRKLGNWDWDGEPTGEDNWARWWCILYPPASLWTQGDSYWGDPELWGGEWGLAGSKQTWGSTATTDQSRTIREILREWKPAGTTCVNIIIAFDHASFDPASPEPDGLWGGHAKLVGGEWVKARLDTALYWHGTAPEPRS